MDDDFDIISMGYESDLWCLTCSRVIYVPGLQPTLGDLVRAAREHVATHERI